MKIIYETPNNKFRIVENETRLVSDIGIYSVLKHMEGLVTDEFDGWTPFLMSVPVKECLSYLRRYNIISKDEMLYQLSLLTNKE